MKTIYLINQSSYDTGTLLHFTHDPMATKKDAHAELESLIELERDCMTDSGYSVFSITEIEVA